MIFFIVMLQLTWVLGDNCSTKCSNVLHRVCGRSTAWDGTIITSLHHNICHLNNIKCRLGDIAQVAQVSDMQCIKKRRRGTKKSRRLLDFGIVGAHQACNHTCPTYCIDAYEPVCAQIWKLGMKKYSYRPMVNHCHVDLFSCSVGLNVTIVPLGKCFANPAGLQFMSQMAAMKSLGLLEARRSLIDLNMDRLNNAPDEVRLDNTERETEHLLRRLLKIMILERLD